MEVRALQHLHRAVPKHLGVCLPPLEFITDRGGDARCLIECLRPSTSRHLALVGDVQPDEGQSFVEAILAQGEQFGSVAVAHRLHGVRDERDDPFGVAVCVLPDDERFGQA